MTDDSFVDEVCRALGAKRAVSGLSSFGLEVVVDEAGPEPTSIEEVRTLLGDCRRCKLCDKRTNIVFGVGASNHPPLMVVGEGPGEHEDRLGEPFVGLAGEMLDRMLGRVLGLRRDQVYVTNIVKCRTSADNRDPEEDEVASCLPFLEMQRNVVAPSFVLLLGSVAISACLKLQGGVRQNRGKWLEWGGIPTIATYHTAYLLRRPEDKPKTMEDLLMLKARLKAAGLVP